MAENQKQKIDQIIDWINKSDYYQIFNLPRTANSVDIRGAYFKLSQQYHPDKYYAKTDAETRRKITVVFMRLNEANSVLRDPQKRPKYDKLISGPEREKHLRYQGAEEDRGPANPEDQATTVNGKKYLKLALVAQKKKDWRTAEMNLNFAIKYEPDNAFFKKFMENVRAEVIKLPKEDPFKIR